MVFLIDSKDRKDCSLELIKIYEKDINYLIVYKYMLSYFGLVPLKDDIMYYYTYNRNFLLSNNNNYYHCNENYYYHFNEKDDSGYKKIILKKYIMRDIKIKNIIDDIS